MAGVQFGRLKHRRDSFHRDQDPAPPPCIGTSGFIGLYGCCRAVPAPGSESYTVSAATAAMDHNRKVRAASAENDRRAVALKDYEQRSAQALATALDSSLRPKSASLLLRLQSKFKDGARSTELGTEVHDGHAMVSRNEAP